MRKAGINKGFLRLFILCGVTIAFSTCALAVDFSLSITSAPKKVPQGAPVSVTVVLKNVSGHPIKLAYGCHGFSILATASKQDGSTVSHLCGPEVSIKPTAGYRIESKPAGWSKRILRFVCLPSEPGEYTIQIVASSTGPYTQVGGKEIEAWSGTINSDKVKIIVSDPAGVDKEAFDFFKGSPLSHPEELMKRFPTSTYTGEVLIHRAPTGVRWSFSCLNDPNKEFQRWFNHGGSQANTQAHIKRAKEKMQSYAKIAGPFLEAHPDFFYAPRIRRYYAMCLGLTGDVPGAMDQIYILAKGQGKEADEAQQYLIERESKKAKK